MFQFTIGRMLLITAGIALLSASLRFESGLSAIRLTGGSLAAFALPSLSIAFFQRIRTRKLQAIGPNATDRIGLIWIVLLVGGIISTMTLFSMSAAREAFEFTSGLTPWLIPISLAAGILFAGWQAIRRDPMDRAAIKH